MIAQSVSECVVSLKVTAQFTWRAEPSSILLADLDASAPTRCERAHRTKLAVLQIPMIDRRSR
ncbi:MAG: hypothetical protein ABJA98_36015 [Acidobacteriota bacterium]